MYDEVDVTRWSGIRSTQALEHRAWLWRQETRATMETKGKHQAITDARGGSQTTKVQRGGPTLLSGFIGSGSNSAWSASSHNYESLATRGRCGSLGPSLPNQVRRSTSFPVFASSSGNISKFQNRRGQGKRRSTRGRYKATGLESLPAIPSSSRFRGWEISGPGRQGVERAQNLRKHRRRPSSFERSCCVPCPYR